jgi:hypothetical protein
MASESELAEISQEEIIRLYERFAAAGEDADRYLRAHYEHLLLSLKRLGESFGPTKPGVEFPWLTPIASTEFFPRVDPFH